MNIERIKEKLTELFSKYRVVFWNDANADFKDDLPECLPHGVDIIWPDEVGQFKAKVTIELDKPEEKFLVYSASSEPRAEDDWLLDIRLYGYQFRADTASMIVEELGGVGVFERFAFHDVTPVTGGVTDAEEDGFCLLACECEGLFSPGIPFHGVVLVLAEVR